MRIVPHRHVSTKVFERVLKSVVLDGLRDGRVFQFRFFGERVHDGEADAVQHFRSLKQVGVHQSNLKKKKKHLEFKLEK